MAEEKEYVLGTGDEEIERLALQHNVWRPRALDAWRRAGFTIGQTLLDIGCGPGHATLDLADVVGQSGRVIAVDRSQRFLNFLRGQCRSRGIENVQAIERDLMNESAIDHEVDGAWCRWVLCFVKNPRTVLERMARSVKPGGALVLHEYFDYSTWRVSPRSSDIEEFVSAVMKSWRDEGGEPDVGLDLPRWLQDLGFEVRSMRPIIDMVSPSNFVWNWPAEFLRSGVNRLVELNHLTAERALEITKALDTCAKDAHSLMVTPAVLEIIATR